MNRDPASIPTTRGPDRDPRRPALALPAGSCDCHSHVFGPADRFPYAATRSYTPPDCTTADYVRMLTAIGCARAVAALADLDGLLATLGGTVVIDHMGQPAIDAGTDAPAFRTLLRALADGRCWVKLSGAYRLSKSHPGYPEVTPFARALVAVNPAQLVWGSDWPHPNFQGTMPNDAQLVDQVSTN